MLMELMSKAFDMKTLWTDDGIVAGIMVYYPADSTTYPQTHHLIAAFHDGVSTC
jgi:hypothetical protein